MGLRLRISSELALDASPEAVGRGRRFAAATLAEWGISGEPVPDATLIVSELLTNAIRHAGPPIRLRLALADDELVIEVEDGSEQLPRPRQAGADALSGRGLGIVARLSRCWAADTGTSGKTVWSVLPIAA